MRRFCFSICIFFLLSFRCDFKKSKKIYLVNLMPDEGNWTWIFINSSLFFFFASFTVRIFHNFSSSSSFFLELFFSLIFFLQQFRNEFYFLLNCTDFNTWRGRKKKNHHLIAIHGDFLALRPRPQIQRPRIMRENRNYLFPQNYLWI